MLWVLYLRFFLHAAAVAIYGLSSTRIDPLSALTSLRT
jgi:hypothetical protein